MDVVVVGILTAVTVTFGTLFWHLLVHPEIMLSVWTRPGDDPHGSWFDHHPGALRALRWATGGVLFLLGFLTGLATTFLVRTGAG